MKYLWTTQYNPCILNNTQFIAWSMKKTQSIIHEESILIHFDKSSLSRQCPGAGLAPQDSTIASSSFSWDNSRDPWRHVAVTVTQNVASRHNLVFYVDAWWKTVETCGKFGIFVGKTWDMVEECWIFKMFWVKNLGNVRENLRNEGENLGNVGEHLWNLLGKPGKNERPKWIG